MQCRQSCKANRLALSCTAEHLRIAVGEETAHIIANHIQARDCLAVCLDSLKVGVDTDTVHCCKQPAAQRNAIERSFFNRCHILLLLAEVKVDALVAELIVTLDGRNGLLVTPGNASQLAEAMGRLIDDADLRQQLGQQAKADFDDHLNYEHYYAKIRRIYNE